MAVPNRLRRIIAVPALLAVGLGVTPQPAAQADNTRLNKMVWADIYKLRRDVGCVTDLNVSPKLRLAAQWHTDDVLNNHTLDGDTGSDGSTVQDRARNAGYTGVVSETVAINPALAINNLQIINQWYYRPDYYTIMTDCSNVDFGVWSENSVDRSVVVAVYGKGEN
ncbi:hypothetical protein MANY_41540 [Mycolicibacterium anyangense]|jgi:uncharacterized protein YkwD|uniref:SCP domain-containing protein n=1 Tax=Mycolicibacterium anyangense TaxID=1431246 RepID=A0A6N4WF56_9MYCO|nr:CAP domain-containing protein [Mycolicibacterium anyangense]BBZ78817.1 hypothetical protein MANY_41540 [Mycolicibacterium anyangense]